MRGQVKGQVLVNLTIQIYLSNCIIFILYIIIIIYLFIIILYIFKYNYIINSV
jgi:hypothetical protein